MNVPRRRNGSMYQWILSCRSEHIHPTTRPATVQIQYLLELKWRTYRVLGFQLVALRLLRRIGLRRRRLAQHQGQGSKDAPPESQYLALELEYPAFRRSRVWQCVVRPQILLARAEGIYEPNLSGAPALEIVAE